MKKFVTLFLFLTLLPAFGQPKAHSQAVRETRKAGGGKPAYKIDFKYPQWGGAKMARADQASKKVVQADIDLFKKSFREDVPNRGIDCYLEGGYEVLYSSANLISVVFNASSYLAGAHPGPITHALLVSPERGTALQISDCFSAGTPWLKTLATYCHKDLVKQMGDSDWTRKGSAPTLENYSLVLPTAKGLQVLFPPYQVASYADGPKEVLVPYSVVRSFIAPAGPLKAFR